MKYLKTYEKKFIHYDGDLKKYIIIKGKNNTYDLFKINNEEYTCVLLKHYNEKTKYEATKLDNDNYEKIIHIIRSDDELIYQSDNFKDALNYFDLILNTEKYNL